MPTPRPRSIVRSVRWTPAEWQAVAERAQRQALPPATYIRRAALGAVSAAPKAPITRRVRYPEPRSASLEIRLHPKELARIRDHAETLGMPASTFVRDAAVGYRISSRADSETIRHLARLGNNLNQATRIAHQAGQVQVGRDLAALLAQLRAVLDRLT